LLLWSAWGVQCSRTAESTITPVSTSSESNRCPLCCLVALLLGLRECERHDEEGEQDWLPQSHLSRDSLCEIRWQFAGNEKPGGWLEYTLQTDGILEVCPRVNNLVRRIVAPTNSQRILLIGCAARLRRMKSTAEA
jgi:hypothetical protein